LVQKKQQEQIWIEKESKEMFKKTRRLNAELAVYKEIHKREQSRLYNVEGEKKNK
jgi:hypothetical protein